MDRFTNLLLFVPILAGSIWLFVYALRCFLRGESMGLLYLLLGAVAFVVCVQIALTSWHEILGLSQ